MATETSAAAASATSKFTSADETQARLNEQMPSRQPTEDMKTFVIKNAGPYRALLQTYSLRNRDIPWEMIVKDVEHQMQRSFFGKRHVLETYLSCREARASAQKWLKAGSETGAPDRPPSPTSGQGENPFKGER